ncbi:hypothetical protein AZE42_08237 [Rhizopogon vesiculosus]|uniref:DUF7918 domain-containing protein n=1 Tax=Rhizopogon vesiculosus TaxID=180088 RepID=A0A1J8QBE0_9AGAM|nr:hypothetical protein AZE42_08237 [Rhizopogon vesiculosus]
MILGDFSASVFFGDQELQEYDVTVDCSTPTVNKITCWIASEEGKKFGVRWKCLAQQLSGIRSGISVDGVHCRVQTVRPGWVGTRDCTCLSNGYVGRDFMFTRLELTDDDSMLDSQNSHDIGQIVVEIKLGKCMEKKVTKHLKSNHTLRVHEGKVHESSKKACSHRVVFGEEVPRPAASLRHGTTSFTVKPDGSLATIFLFKYTRLDVLQAMGIAPSSSKNPINEDIKDCCNDDQIEIIDGPYEASSSKDIKPRIRRLEKELQRLRAQQANSSEDRKPSRVKLECGGARRHDASPEILDLTED